MWEVAGMPFREGEKFWSLISTLPLIQFQGHGPHRRAPGSSTPLSKMPGS